MRETQPEVFRMNGTRRDTRADRQELLARHRHHGDRNRVLMVVRMPAGVSGFVGRILQGDRAIFRRLTHVPKGERGDPDQHRMYWMWVSCEVTARRVFAEFGAVVIATCKCEDRPSASVQSKKARRWAQTHAQAA